VVGRSGKARLRLVVFPSGWLAGRMVPSALGLASCRLGTFPIELAQTRRRRIVEEFAVGPTSSKEGRYVG